MNLGAAVLIASFLAASLLPARVAGANAPRPLPRFTQVRERIQALFEHRDAPPAAPDPRANPFAPPSSAGPAAEDAPEAPADNDLALLQLAIAQLKVNGTFEKDNQLHLVINARPYRKDDVIRVRVRGRPVELRLRELSRRATTLALNNAELTLKF